MEIKGISNNPFFINSSKSKKGEAASTPGQKDKIEISAEAREKVVSGELDLTRVNEIREKIASGFYNTDEVLNKVADKLSADLKI